MNDILGHMRKWQTLYAVIISVCVAFVSFFFTTDERLTNLEDRITKVEGVQETNILLLVEIQKDIVELRTETRTSFDFIKQQLK